MSADLLAEFGDVSQSPKKGGPTLHNSSASNDLLVDFGSLNEIESVTVSHSGQGVTNTYEPSSKTPVQFLDQLSLVQPTKSDPPDKYRSVPPSTRQESPLKEEKRLWHSERDGSNVLFDADTQNPWEDDEEFGDFETGAGKLQGDDPNLLNTDPSRSQNTAAGARCQEPPKGIDKASSGSTNLIDNFLPPNPLPGLPREEFALRPLQDHEKDFLKDRSARSKPRETSVASGAGSSKPAEPSPAGFKLPHDDVREKEEDDWGEFMDAPAGDLAGDEATSYPENLPTISPSLPPELNLPTKQAQPDQESIFGFIPFEKKPRPSLTNIKRPTSYTSTVASDGEESPGWDWKVATGSKSSIRSPLRSGAPQALLRPSAADMHRPSSFSTAASSDDERSPGWDWKPSEPPKPVEHVRPFNIPPPSILLQLFPAIFERFQERIFQQTVSRSSDKGKDNSLLELGRQVGSVSRVAGRILAGRKHRWRRDTNLSQNMKIGPAQTGKGGGMKLTGIDKNENTREEREAEDVLQVWKRCAGLFRSAITSAGETGVELSENMLIKTLGPNQGAFKATHACALCGLLRDERVIKIEGHVEDSFGEWWTEHWGHLECRLFWEENQASLAHR